MSATGPGSEHFGWVQHNEDPEAWWAELERMRQLEAEGVREDRARRDVQALLRFLRDQGLLREDRLSHTRICELEHETGIFSGSWSEYYGLLREAQRKDEEARRASA